MKAGVTSRLFCLILAAGVVFGAAMAASAQVDVDGALPEYERTSGVSGNINSIGSDTLNNLMTLWAESFRAIYPNVNIQIEGKGSSTAPPALIEGTAQLGPMSREMKSSELDKFEKEFGYKPTPVRVAIDALAVFVHKDNPVEGLTLEQVDSIFSSTYKRGGTDIGVWGDAGLDGDWAARPVSLYGRNSASGTYGFFKSVALKKGDYKDTVKEQPGSSSVVQGVASDLGGVGYSGIGYKTSSVRALPIADQGPMYEPNLENCLSGDYPLARFLYIYVNKKPGAELDKLTFEFLNFINSKAGQEIVVKDGYFPLPAVVSADTMTTLQ
ncbi:MAG: phosphate ABC transporter substrate-binding protein PstS family protein [Candidatus Tectomicrobia bacterium]|nr:phosphate ABC transporter substrate-binding protein PstS family protein [Candidatus Tectomicrobia bacterium]